MSALDDRGPLAAAVDAVFDCGQPTQLGPCAFMAGHDGDHTGLMPVVELCRLCKGRTRVPGTDDTCPACDGAGIEKPRCPTCNGAGGWQQHDGLIVECPRGCMTDGAS